jgi:hypothetical protein
MPCGWFDATIGGAGDMTDQAPTPPKRPYETPRLVTYGDIKTLTQNTVVGQKADKGGAQKNRTS